MQGRPGPVDGTGLTRHETERDPGRARPQRASAAEDMSEDGGSSTCARLACASNPEALPGILPQEFAVHAVAHGAREIGLDTR